MNRMFVTSDIHGDDSRCRDIFKKFNKDNRTTDNAISFYEIWIGGSLWIGFS